MPEFLLPLLLIYVHPIVTDVKVAIRSPVFERLSVRQQMNVICAYLDYVCTARSGNKHQMKYDYGLSTGEHLRLLDYLEQYIDDLIADMSPLRLSKAQVGSIRPRLLFKVTGTQTLPVIIGVDSENHKDRELYDRHM